MHERDDEDLTTAEREAFEALPREAMPSRLLEERIVAELHARGVLGARRHAAPWGWGRWGIGVAAAAGAVAMFASGLAVGQWVGARHTAAVMMEQQRQDAANTAATVERTGSAYLSALGALSQQSPSTDPAETARARAAAQNVLRQAANEMVRLAPDDPVSTQILQGLERAHAQSADTKPAGAKRVVWF